MSEVTFAKTFLATLDKKPIKLPADHVSDPRKHPNQSPTTLPKQTHPFPRKTGPSALQQAATKTITATLKPMRAGETLILPSVTLDTTVHDLKCQYVAQAGLQLDKIKLLLNKKPVADLKTLKDLDVDGDVELSVMVMGGATSTSGAQSPAAVERDRAPTPKVELPTPAAPAAQDKMDIDEKSSAPESEKATAEASKTGTSGDDVAEMLKSDDFWTDLKGFLSQRLRNEQQGENLSIVFKEAWRKSRS